MNNKFDPNNNKNQNPKSSNNSFENEKSNQIDKSSGFENDKSNGFENDQARSVENDKANGVEKNTTNKTKKPSNNSNLKRILLLLGIFALLMTVAFSIFTVLSMSEDQLRQEMVQSIGNADGRDTHLAVGKNIFDAEYDDVLNTTATLQDTILDNEVTVVNYFASWCVPCQREMPELKTLHQETKDSDVGIIAINVDDQTKNRNEFLSEHEVEFPVYEFHDEPSALDEYKVNVIPTTFFVNNEGEIIRAFIGEVHLDLLNTYISYVKEEN